MILSMTGFGKAEISATDRKVNIEIKCLNSKNADISIKMPYLYREKELGIRQIINDTLERGKIDVTIYHELREGTAPSTINQDVVRSYYAQLLQISSDLQLSAQVNLLDVVMRLPDTLKTEKTTLAPNEWEDLKAALVKALEEDTPFRSQEVKALEADLRMRAGNILSGLDRVAPYESARFDKVRSKLASQIEESGSKIEIDKNRFEQEMIYYLEKLDISEEKSRLRNHLSYFNETLSSTENSGKKLGFISQEIGREINTLGSKASDFDIQKIVVEMKDELEKIKEQLLNVL
jgi:uncharacterized protein (TIGR00255 family)